MKIHMQLCTNAIINIKIYKRLKMNYNKKIEVCATGSCKDTVSLQGGSQSSYYNIPGTHMSQFRDLWLIRRHPAFQVARGDFMTWVSQK